MPINQLASLCLTVGYYPNYSEQTEHHAHEVENIVVSNFEIDSFIREAQQSFIFGLDEFEYESFEELEDDCPTVAKYLNKWKRGLSPRIISALYIDEMGKCMIVAEGLDVENTQWEVSKGFLKG